MAFYKGEVDRTLLLDDGVSKKTTESFYFTHQTRPTAGSITRLQEYRQLGQRHWGHADTPTETAGTHSAFDTEPDKAARQRQHEARSDETGREQE